ncbi:nucleoside monophosphate kinase [Streptomyces cinnabarinus]|uniref:Adenylate kinase n=1 Tax=Streptomyces cinnabarinus TaxID=67287 RepID=A0ABY7K8H0_9ACTN|nr:nucleoside monophosphate kinase [Streptomyces cinnabarinus]WAZ19587.1 nucleoside monophosphate kinase [Streptomyces cinnabarinus]
MTFPPIIAVLGVPGAGKSTQAKAVARGLGGVSVSVGDWLRALAAAGDEDAASTVAAGSPITPAQYERFLRHVRDEVPASVLVLDGSPRDERHVPVLADALADDAPVFGVLLQLPTGVAESRIEVRRSNAPTDRPDDAAGAAARRIADQTAALTRLAESFEARWPLVTIDATDEESLVTRRILESLPDGWS